MVDWTPQTMPDDWMRFRTQWEYSHALRAILMIIGLGALIYSILVETPVEHPHEGEINLRRSSEVPLYAKQREWDTVNSSN